MSLSPFNLFGLSCQSLMGNPLRSTLSAVGVFMGVAAVTATLQVRTISRTVISQQIEAREAPTLRLNPAWEPGREIQPLTLEDLEFLQHRLRGATAIAGQRYSRWWVDSVVFQDRSVSPEYVLAVSQDYQKISGRKVLEGRFFNATDFLRYRPVVVIDEVLAKELFETVAPIDQSVYIKNRPYIVVGVVETKEFSSRSDQQGLLMMPLPLDTAVTGQRKLHTIAVGVDRIEDMEAVEKRAIALMKQRVPTQDYRAWKNINDILEQKQTLESVSRALLVVGGIALVVGGVGIANVTIASVIERTPEIGLRRAIGATQLDVMSQFILEAAILSVVGGTIAIATVHGITLVIADRFELPYEFDRQTAAIALGSSVVVGIGAAFFPALRASQLDPVKALRGQ
ncbi:ABC transporter permease [Lyngbya sp. CCY1209]|uniref:ABC transporter permease n=1 Tax=Lyngbya sp. CCY1209 TaxID=2886103 RepID=UPI002D213710|nr:ABC transporter permease [Lyngbya sp. CCY1209]MEB3884324.1 ABC transporter permease [Lyngbya sp. CCY1209]